MGLFLIAAGCLFPIVTLADGCMGCHQSRGVKVRKLPVMPVKMTVDGNQRIVTLDGVFKYHGDECPGVIIAYRAAQYGIKLLFRDEVPERNDLLIFSRTPAGGVRDCIDFLMKGDNPPRKTAVPAGMVKTRDGFAFAITRKSTCETVEVRLNQALFPADFFALKKKAQGKTITEDEWKRLHGHMKYMILGFSSRPAEEMFGKPEPYKTIMWGSIKPGEQDKNIQRMKQKEKAPQVSRKKTP